MLDFQVFKEIFWHLTEGNYADFFVTYAYSAAPMPHGTVGATMTLTVANASSDASVNIGVSDTITLTVTLPATLTPTAAAGTGWSTGIAGQVVTCTITPGSPVPPLGTLAPLVITFTVGSVPSPPQVVTSAVITNTSILGGILTSSTVNSTLLIT